MGFAVHDADVSGGLDSVQVMDGDPGVVGVGEQAGGYERDAESGSK